MAEETRVTLQLDVEDAKRALAALQKDAENTGGKAASGIRSAIRRGVGAFGIGGAFGAGLQAVGAATRSGIGDIVGDVTGEFGAKAEQTLLGPKAQDARATQAAREQFIATFGATIKSPSDIGHGMKSWFDSIKAIKMREEVGRGIVERDPRFRSEASQEIKDGVAKIVAAITETSTSLLHAAKTAHR